MATNKYDQLEKYALELKEPSKSIVLSLLKDFCYIEAEIERLKPLPRYIINPNNPKQQKKLPVHEILKDLQAQKNDIATKILRTLDNDITEESPLIKALKRFEK